VPKRTQEHSFEGMNEFLEAENETSREEAAYVLEHGEEATEEHPAR